jgi:hypothetical protein
MNRFFAFLFLASVLGTGAPSASADENSAGPNKADFARRPLPETEKNKLKIKNKQSPYQSAIEAAVTRSAEKDKQEKRENVTELVQKAVRESVQGIVKISGKDVRIRIGDDIVGIGERLPPISVETDKEGGGKEKRTRTLNLILDAVTDKNLIIRLSDLNETVTVPLDEFFQKK